MISELRYADYTAVLFTTSHMLDILVNAGNGKETERWTPTKFAF